MKERDYYFDNMKFILIVFGHLLRSFNEHNEVIFSIYKVIYSFHMPAFILVSGYFAKGFLHKGSVTNIAKLALTLLLSSKMVTSFAQPLIEIRLTKLRKLKNKVLTLYVHNRNIPLLIRNFNFILKEKYRNGSK